MRLFTLSFILVCLFTIGVHAQTPQQIEMLKKRGDYGQEAISDPVYIDEKTGEVVIPKNPNPQILEIEDGQKIVVPMAKTDDQVRATRFGPNFKLLSQMNEEQQKEYMEYIMQDRIFLSTSNFTITTAPSGLKYCQMQLNILNNTPRKLKKIHISYSWGDTKTYVDFSNVDVAEVVHHGIALAGDVCNRVVNGANYNVGECSMEGLTQEQCRLRIAEL